MATTSINFRRFLVVSSFAILSACGGSTTIGSAFLNVSDGASAFSATAVRSDGGSGELVAIPIAGLIHPETGEFRLDDGVYQLRDSDGLEGERATDGVAVFASGEDIGFSEDYNETTVFTLTYRAGGTNYDLTGLYGTSPDAAQFPTAGTAFYQGEATGFFVANTSAVDLRNGRSELTADFDAGVVSIVLTDFEVIQTGTSNVGVSPFDTLRATGLPVDNGRFAGDAVSFENSGVVVDVSQENLATSIEGAFFGEQATEAGGTIVSTAPDVQFVMTFVGKEAP